jgi:hypothetical protein
MRGFSMANQHDLFGQNPEKDRLKQDAEFEWLLCLSSALQAGAGLIPTRAPETEPRPTRPANPAEALSHRVSKWQVALLRMLRLSNDGGSAKRPAA